MKTVQELEQRLTEPSAALIEDLQKTSGDIMVLGVGGKMGPTLAKLAKNALDQAGSTRKVIGVSRFSDAQVRNDLEEHGVQTLAIDLLDDAQLQQLPEIENIIYMAGNKFGTTGREYFTWAMNAYLPGRVAEKFKNSRIVSFSSGNLYPIMPIKHGGASEDEAPEPIGEYAQSCLARERIFEHFSRLYNIPMVHYRLNYAIDLRYGVLLEIAKAVHEQKPIDLRMGHVNVIWQGDANEIALRALNICDTPPKILNVTGPETISVAWLANKFGELLGNEPIFEYEEEDTALLNNASESHRLFGYPRVSLRQMIEWTAEWVLQGGDTLNKPTHFQERKGAY